MTKTKLKQLDVVLTKHGTIAVVERVDANGRVSLVLPEKSLQKAAWYEPEEVRRIASVIGLVQTSNIVY